ncbi:hypothetical protein BSL78_03829 [Apostichopus japonicus]|uniref:Reverse transcriptase domain-containing protein n=1 Tax=Stichopus japonicus TaxID=307972 RepID=A0A2G8LG69_STIJA|nr:hypothetical protein BSL78_03829 [Apostichopus japonicus]
MDLIIIRTGLWQSKTTAFSAFDSPQVIPLKQLEPVGLLDPTHHLLSNEEYTALLAENEDQLQRIVNEVKERSERMGLKMNTKKTKAMLVSRLDEGKELNIRVNGELLEQVKSFKYLGQTISDDGRCDKDIRSRIEIAGGSFIKLKDVLTSKNIKLATRKRMVRCYVLSTLLYASETWTLSTGTENKIEAFEMWLYRKMLKVSYKDRMSNEEVLDRVSKERKLLPELKNRRCSIWATSCDQMGFRNNSSKGRWGAKGKEGDQGTRGWQTSETGQEKILHDLARTAEYRTKWRNMASRASKGQGNILDNVVK